MTTSGQFIDDKGNVYKRLKPMNSKNIYENTGSTLKVKMPKYTRKHSIDEKQMIMDLSNNNPTSKDIEFINIFPFLKLVNSSLIANKSLVLILFAFIFFNIIHD